MSSLTLQQQRPSRVTTHDEIQPPDPRPERAAANLACPGDVHNVEAPFDHARAGKVLPGGDERASGRVAPRGADALEIAREEDGGDERKHVHPERECRWPERGGTEKEAEEQRKSARDQEAQPEVLDCHCVLLRWRVKDRVSEMHSQWVRH